MASITALSCSSTRRSPAGRNISIPSNTGSRRDWEQPCNIKPYIRAINAARRANAALQQTRNLTFLNIDNADVIGFVKQSDDRSNIVAVAIALTREPQEFWFPLPDLEIGADGERRFVAAVENLITGERLAPEWGGLHLRLDPLHDPALLFRCLA